MSASKHFLARARERCGIDFTDRDIRALCRQARDRSGVLLAAQSAGCERWLVMHGKTALIVVYNRVDNRLVTLLPRDGKKLNALKNRGFRFGRQRVYGRRPEVPA